MKKNSIYVLVVFMFMFFGILEVDALTCHYQDPFSSFKEIVLEFTNENSFSVTDSVSVESKNNETCIDSSKSSSDVKLWNRSSTSNPKSFSRINGYNYVYHDELFAGTGCLRASTKCPELAYVSRGSGDNQFYVLTEKTDSYSSLCYNSVGDCKSLKLKGSSLPADDNNGDSNGDSNNSDTKGSVDMCNDFTMVWTIFGYIIFAIQIVIPLLLIISGMITMTSAILEKEESKIKNAQNLLVKKLIAAVIAFLVIAVVKIVVSLVTVGDWEGCVKCALHPFSDGCGIIKGEINTDK